MVESGYSGGDFITSFSPGANFFAFQSNRSQKNSIELYPLQDINNLQITSSQVHQIDYENYDLLVSEVKLLTWCNNNIPTENNAKTRSVKRRGNEEIQSERTEQYFVNVFPKGKIVVYSSNGKEIINIIQNKKDILGIDSNEDVIWILDDEKTVKRFNYTTSKPLQTFHLTDGKNDDIINFQLLRFPNKLLLAITTEEVIYIIDPSKKRPSTFAKIENFGSISCTVYDEDHVVIADVSKVILYSLSEKKSIMEWNIECEKVKVHDDTIVVLDVSGNIKVLSAKSEEPLASVKVENSEILDFELKEDSIVLAWIDVNEPKFEVISKSQLEEKKEFAFNSTSPIDTVSEITEETVNKDKPESNRKVSKKEQNETAQMLISALVDSDSNPVHILDLLLQPAWTDHNIHLFVRDDVNEDIVNKLFDVLAKHISANPASTGQASTWLKWLLTLRRSQIKSINSNTNKLTKRLRSSLRTSAESLPTLLSIQGKLEMLAGQSLLRKQFASMDVNQETSSDVQNGEQDDDAEAGFLFENGEADELDDQSQELQS